jgi:hypothetical protein
VRWSRVAQHLAVSLTKTSRFGALLTLGKQMSTRCNPTVDARSRVRLLEESVLMPQCCDRVGGERRPDLSRRPCGLPWSLLPVAA